MYTPRVRLQDNVVGTGYTYSIVRAGTLLGPPYDGKTNFSIGDAGSRNGISDRNNARELRKKSRGYLVMSDMSLGKWSREFSPGMVAGFVPQWQGGEQHTITGDFSWGVLHSSALTQPEMVADIDQMAGVALVKAFAKVNRSAIMGGELLLDLEKSVAMLRRPFANSVKLLKKINFRRKSYLARKSYTALRASAQAWLEERYGWTPIVLDMDTIFRRAGEIRRQLGEVRYVARAQETRSLKRAVPFAELPLAAPLSAYRATGTLQTEQTARACAGVIYDLKNRTTTEELNAFLGSRPRDMAPLLYEKIPYSFILDWFTNTGTWIEAVTPNPDVNVVAKWVTTVYDRTDTISGGLCKLPVTWASPYPVFTGSLGSCVQHQATVARDTNPDLMDTPALTFTSLSMLHSADAAALSLRPIRAMLEWFKH